MLWDPQSGEGLARTERGDQRHHEVAKPSHNHRQPPVSGFELSFPRKRSPLHEFLRVLTKTVSQPDWNGRGERRLPTFKCGADGFHERCAIEIKGLREEPQSFILLLPIPRSTIAWNFTATTVLRR